MMIKAVSLTVSYNSITSQPFINTFAISYYVNMTKQLMLGHELFQRHSYYSCNRSNSIFVLKLDRPRLFFIKPSLILDIVIFLKVLMVPQKDTGSQLSLNRSNI